MITLASIPRCGSTYAFRSIAGLPQGSTTPPGAQEEHGIVKTHRTPASEPRLDLRAPALFIFGDIVDAVVSTRHHRWERQHAENCGAVWPPPADILDQDVFGYAELYRAWLRAPFPVLFVRYEAMRYWRTRGLIESWLRRDVEWLPWRERLTDPSHDERRRVEVGHADLIAEVSRAPSVCVCGSCPKEESH